MKKQPDYNNIKQQYSEKYKKYKQKMASTNYSGGNTTLQFLNSTIDPTMGAWCEQDREYFDQIQFDFSKIPDYPSTTICQLGIPDPNCIQPEDK